METRILNRNNLFHGHIFNIENVQLELPDHRNRNYELVNHRDSVTIVPVTDSRKILFVSQYRIGAEQDLLELPAGVIERNETPKECAAREIREEVGMTAGDLYLLGSCYLVPGYCTELNYMFLAQKLSPSPLQPDDDEFLNIVAMPIDEVFQKALGGYLKDSKSLAALFLSQSIIQNHPD